MKCLGVTYIHINSETFYDTLSWEEDKYGLVFTKEVKEVL